MMNSSLAAFAVLPWPDWLALFAFFAGWVGYALWARRRTLRQPSVLAASNAERRRWMLQTTWRENRVIDGIVVQSMSTSPSFFASTTILIIGGLLAVLSTGETNELIKQVPFAARTSALVFDLKLLLLLGIFIYAFFRFTWSLRQYTFGALLVASAPDWKAFEQQPDSARDAFADRAGKVVGMAAETFNDGLRAYYMAFAAIGWFFSPVGLVAATAVVVYILYRREFHSEVLDVLNAPGADR